MNTKVTFVLLLALARAIHINDDTANAQGSQPDFNFPSQADYAAQQQQTGFGFENQQAAAQQAAAQQAADQQAAAQQAAAQQAAAQQATAQQASQSNYAANVDLQSLPGPDVAILAGLWGLYQDLIAPSATLNLIYAANLNNADGSVNWRLVYQLVGPNWGVTYIAVQVIQKGGRWTHDHAFFTHTLSEIIYLWGLPANTSFGNLNVQGLLAAVLARNPFAQISQSAIQQAVDAAKADFQATLQQAQADKAAADGQISQLKAQIEGLNSQIATLQSTIQTLQVTIQSNAANAQNAAAQQAAAQQAAAQQAAAQQASQGGRGWARDQDQAWAAQQQQQAQQAQFAQQQAQQARQAPASTRGATIGRGGNVQFPNAVLNIGSALRKDE